MRDDERTARAALSRLFEPQDAAGLALVQTAGAEDALRIATGQLGRRSGAGTGDLRDHGGQRLRQWLGRADAALKRWAPRVPDLAPARDLATMARLGGRLIIPSDELWPRQLADLGLQEPLCLWWRGVEQELPPGRQVRRPGGFPRQHLLWVFRDGRSCLLAGPARLHRSSPAAPTGSMPTPTGRPWPGAPDGLPTIAVMAGGVDRFYPSGNEDLLRAVANQGAVLAEVPPGSAPTRYRFLQRNRLIAALASVTVVVEARWRSGALNTAHHAESLGRAVGRRPRIRAQRQFRRLPPAAPRRRGRLRHRCGGDRRARLAQRRIPARRQGRAGRRSTTA